MNTFRQVRTAAIIAAGLAGALAFGGVAAAQVPAAEPQELAWSVEEQPEALLSRKVLDSAGAYQLHAARAVRGPVMRASNQQADQLLRGAAAFAATVAVKDPEFAASVRWLASDPMARKRIAARVLQNPAYAARFDPTGATAGRVTAALKTDASPALVTRGLALAALAVLGETDAARTEPLMDDAACGSCLRMSKLNLFQCLAVAKPWYEDVFCLGQHVLIDTGDCIQAAAVAKPAPPAPVLAEPRAPYQPSSGGPLTTVAALN